MSTPSPQLHIYQDGAAVADAFAVYLSKKIAAAGDRPFYLALSGGSTPKLLFKILAEEYADRIDWSKLHLFWGDERMVPHDDAQSNYGEVKKLLLSQIDMPAENVHPVPTQLTSEAAAEQYAATIEATLDTKNELPVFDLIILGMGDDGHTASIFPHQMDLLEATEICAVATHPESGQLRVSLTGPVINNAREICFLVTGSGKKSRVAQILNQEAGYQDYPTAHVRPRHGELHWFLDRAAAKDLK